MKLFRNSLVVGVVVWLFAAMAMSARNEVRTPLQDVARLAARSDVHQAFDWFRVHEREIADRQVEVSRIAAPPMGEQLRAEWLRHRFHEIGLEQVHVDTEGNVLGVLPGKSKGKCIAVAAHIDTVFPAGTQLDVRREGTRLVGPGISDNATGVVALLALASALKHSSLRLESPVLFVGNVGEEGEGDLRGMRFLFNQSKWKDEIAYTVIVDGSGIETVITQALGSRRFEVIVRGPGGHSWSDYGTPNPINALARAIESFRRIPVPPEPKTTTNIGSIRGGTSVNAIPESASMKVDVRSAETAQVDRLEAALRDAVDAAIASENKNVDRTRQLRADVRIIGDRPAAELDPNARILQVVHAVDTHLGLASRAHRASTDANVPLAMGREAVTLGGGGSGGGAHTMREWYDPTGRDVGLRRLLLVILGLAGVSE